MARRIRSIARRFFWDRLKLDRPIIIPGDGNRLMQFVFVNDLVEPAFNALEKHTRRAGHSTSPTRSR